MNQKNTMSNKIKLLLTAIFVLISSQAILADDFTWNLNPINGNWNEAQNWTPEQVPRGTDTAHFAVSNVTSVNIESQTEIRHIIFDGNASAYTFTLDQLAGAGLLLRGIANNSGQLQNFVNTASCDGGEGTVIHFAGNASAGSQTLFTNEGGSGLFGNGAVGFYDQSTAGEAIFVNKSVCEAGFLYGGGVGFIGEANAGAAIFINEGGAVSGGGGGVMNFLGNATAANANITVHGGAVPGAIGAYVFFASGSSAGSATFFVEGGQAEDALEGVIQFIDSSAENANFTINGGTAGSAFGGVLLFDEFADAGNAICIINGGTEGGPGGNLQFVLDSTGGASRIELFGNGTLDITSHYRPGLTVGSLEGDGIVLLGHKNLTIGSNNLTTEFSGNIQNNGSLTKVGTGTLTLSGANTYNGSTTVTAGVLNVSNTTGSGTGSGPVQVNSGTLGGHGRIAGAVTIGTGSGTGAFLAPADGTATRATLTIQNPLTFNSDATYTYSYRAKSNTASTDLVVANGVTINSGATVDFDGTINGRLTPGLVFTVISNTSVNPINGIFSNLPDGSTITLAGNTFQVNYEGGDGNDLALTVVP
jgi:autotransporter-associated beta strand protein